MFSCDAGFDYYGSKEASYNVVWETRLRLVRIQAVLLKVLINLFLVVFYGQFEATEVHAFL